MNAARICLLAGLALACAEARAHPPGPPGHHPQPPVPHTVAPSSLPYAADLPHTHVPYAIEYPRRQDDDVYGIEERCIVRRSMQEPSGDITDSQVIDWCAVAPFEPRYAPQIPAEWWWRRGPWREWRPW